MRKYLVLFAICFVCTISSAQNVGIGTANPQNKLHVAGGFRLDTLTGINGSGLLRHDANGVVYGIKFSGNVSDVLRGDGTFGSGGAGSVGWLLNGNGGTNPATNFIGTTDNQPLLFKVNNIRHGFLSSNNIFFGSNAGLSNVVKENIGIGNGVLQNNIEGLGLLGVGDSVLHNNTYGNYNTAIGNRAMYQNFLGSRNTAVGYESLSKAYEGSDNTGIGYRALFQNDGFDTRGINNTAVGSLALSANTWGSENTATGYRALATVQTGSSNSAFGAAALANNTTIWNSAFGANALSSNTTGFANNAFGRGALFNNTTGGDNVAIGTNALFNNITGSFNTAIGNQALNLNRAAGNSAVGYQALVKNTTGAVNTAVGYLGLENATTGAGNTAMGGYALRTITTGNFNTAVGYQAGWGYNPNTPNLPLGLPPDVSNVTCIGFDAGFRTTSSNQVNIGNFSIGWIGGNVGWGTYSDKRMKQDIKEDIPGLAFITRLKPVSYHINLAKEKDIAGANSNDGDWDGKYDIEKRKMTGFLAQDVEGAANEINYNFSGIHKPKNGDGLYSLEYGAFVVPLVKAVQEQQKIIEDQNKKIDKQQQQIDLLIKEVQSLKKESLTQKN